MINRSLGFSRAIEQTNTSPINRSREISQQIAHLREQSKSGDLINNLKSKPRDDQPNSGDSVK